MGNPLFFLAGAFAAHCASVLFTEAYGVDGRIIDVGFMWLPFSGAGFIDSLAFIYPLAVAVWLSARHDWGRLDLYIRQNAALMLMRAAATAVTILPPAYEGCHSDYLLLRGGCYDKVFSGHTAYQLLAALHARRLAFPAGRKNAYAAYLLFVPVLVEACLLVATREHYTVDVLIAVFLAVLVDGYRGPVNGAGPATAPVPANVTGPTRAFRGQPKPRRHC